MLWLSSTFFIQKSTISKTFTLQSSKASVTTTVIGTRPSCGERDHLSEERLLLWEDKRHRYQVVAERWIKILWGGGLSGIYSQSCIMLEVAPRYKLCTYTVYIVNTVINVYAIWNFSTRVGNERPPSPGTIKSSVMQDNKVIQHYQTHFDYQYPWYYDTSFDISLTTQWCGSLSGSGSLGVVTITCKVPKVFCMMICIYQVSTLQIIMICKNYKKTGRSLPDNPALHAREFLKWCTQFCGSCRQHSTKRWPHHWGE